MGEPVAKAIYPALIPPEDGHPTRDLFEIGLDSARGRGLRSKAPFARGQRVAKLSGVLVSAPGLNTIQIAPGIHLHDEWFCRFILHSCDPNLEFDLRTLEAMAIRPIAPGDALSVDYAVTEDRLDRQFACACGAANCRGWILGRKEEPSVEGLAVLARRRPR